MTSTQFMHTTGRRLATGLKMLRAASAALLALFALSTITASPARAAIGTTDNVPAATLLVPYFEVDLNNENGPQTAVRVMNNSATAVLLNVVLWTDYGVPTYSFTLYHPGYASTDIDLRLLFKGVPPVTASAGQDPTDKITPKGPFSQDINFASCSGMLPPPLIPAATVTGLRNAHTGQGSTLLSGNCGGVAYGDNIARGYITIDTVNSCPGFSFPSDAGYLGNGGTGRATNQNVISGTVLYLNRSTHTTFSEPLVGIEAAPGSGTTATYPPDPLTSSGAYTFYGRYTGFTAADNREPLSAISQARYTNGGVLNDATNIIVWRDPGVAVLPFACGGAPAGFPLGQTEVLAFDDQEHFAPVTGNPFPYATQNVSSASMSPFFTGYFRFNLTLSGGDPVIAGRHQSYVSIHRTWGGQYSGALPAQQIKSASSTTPNTPIAPAP